MKAMQLAAILATTAAGFGLLLLPAQQALRGSLRAYPLCLGVLTFTAYSYIICTFSIPFGPLFLL